MYASDNIIIKTPAAMTRFEGDSVTKPVGPADVSFLAVPFVWFEAADGISTVSFCVWLIWIVCVVVFAV